MSDRRSEGTSEVPEEGSLLQDQCKPDEVSCGRPKRNYRKPRKFDDMVLYTIFE